MKYFSRFLQILLPLQAFTSTLPSSSRSEKLQVRWRRPRVLGNPGRFTNFVNQPRDFVHLHKQVYFDACPYTLEKPITTTKSATYYRWTIFSTPTTIIYDFNGTSCLHEWKAPSEGIYTIQVTAVIGTTAIRRTGGGDETKSSTTAATAISSADSATAVFFVKDIWLAALGDSFASGQGNPDTVMVNESTGRALWVNSTCFRSSYGSFSYLIYDRIARAYPRHGVLFTYVACSDASVQQGLLGPQPYQSAQITDLLEPIIVAAQKQAYVSKDRASKTKPDLILLTVGANDIGFFDVASDLVLGVLRINVSFERLQLPKKLANLSASLGRVNDRFKSDGIDPSSVFYFEYYDPLRNEKGELDASCEDMMWATTDDVRVASEKVLRPLNALIRNESRRFGWNCVDNVEEAFRTHGICSKQSYIRSMRDTTRLQGNAYGTYHPTYIGHRLVAQIAWPKIDSYLGKKFPRS